MWNEISIIPNANIQALLKQGNLIFLGYYEPDIQRWVLEDGQILPTESFCPTHWKHYKIEINNNMEGQEPTTFIVGSNANGAPDPEIWSRLINRANDPEKDGHFTIMKFTSNWRIGFGTPSDRDDINMMHVGLTFNEAAKAALEGMPQMTTCNWAQEEEGQWLTGCNNAFEFIDGTPKQNRMMFCCYCGKPLRDLSHDR